MRAETFILGQASDLRRVIAFVNRITFDGRPWKVTIERVEPGAGTDQEAVLRGMERQIAEHTGNDPEDVHDALLRKHYGVEKVEIGGAVLERPARRTRTGRNKLKRSEMHDHLRYVEAFAAAELGLQVGR